MPIQPATAWNGKRKRCQSSAGLSKIRLGGLPALSVLAAKQKILRLSIAQHRIDCAGNRVKRGHQKADWLIAKDGGRAVVLRHTEEPLFAIVFDLNARLIGPEPIHESRHAILLGDLDQSWLLLWFRTVFLGGHCGFHGTSLSAEIDGIA